MPGVSKLTQGAIRSFLLGRQRGALPPAAKLSDGGGLYLFVTPAGTPVWRVKYRWAGRERTFSIGPLAEVSLSRARQERERVRQVLASGADPVQARELDRRRLMTRGALTVGAVAADWLAQRQAEWTSAKHFANTSRDLERFVLPEIGDLPVTEVTPAMVAKIVRPIAAAGTRETADKVLSTIRQIFDLAMVHADVGIRENPARAARAVLRPSLAAPRRRPALQDLAAIGAFLRAADAAPLSPAVRLVHRLIAFTAVRLSNAVAARWEHFDLEGPHPAWIIPRAEMKVKDRDFDHVVLLGPTIADELRRWRAAVGASGYLFRSPHGRNPHVTPEAIEKAYRVTLGMGTATGAARHSVHGWRASFATLAKEARDPEGRPLFPREAVDRALDHVGDSAVARAYDRGERLADRRRLAAWWDAQLTEAQYPAGSGVLPFPARGVA